MEILICLLIVTAVVVLWAHGNLFASVFLTLPTVGVVAFVADYLHNSSVWAFGAALLVVIWAPCLIRLGRGRY